jgi:hypothetical protein
MLQGMIFLLQLLEDSLLVFIFKHLHNLIRQNTSQQTITDICPTLDLSSSFLELAQLPSVSGMRSKYKMNVFSDCPENNITLLLNFTTLKSA